jgi:propanol-preferring alcohol dehydrogenase
VAREYTYFGSFWGNYNDLTEVLALAAAGQIKHTVTRVRFDDINETLDAIARGDVLGRAVVIYD